jgi:hypothetical protein
MRSEQADHHHQHAHQETGDVRGKPRARHRLTGGAGGHQAEPEGEREDQRTVAKQ